ncbi:S1C family serine protease [Candidatus Pelagibacter sp.]|uniref:S1C family serine protease n=1 Tax=Candidatus Pelagibacter sp. TaxID=2024849 RepID=UPI003F8553FE
MKRLLIFLFAITSLGLSLPTNGHSAVFCKNDFIGWGTKYEIRKYACRNHPKKLTSEEFAYGYLNDSINKSINDLNTLKALFKLHKVNTEIIKKVVFDNQELSSYRKFYGKNDLDITIADKTKIEEEKKKIAEEKRKIEEEKKRIADAKKKQEEEERKKKEDKAKLYIIGSGTGFFVSAEGHVVSNDHVVGICKKVVSKINGELKYFNILKTDQINDLGLIKGDYKSASYLSIKSDGAEFGEDIIAFGYPLADALSTSVKLTRGIVSSLSGPGNNYSEIQIDAAIQPGNSGGPVMNMDGQVVGVASSGLNKLYMLEKSEYIPENVNFAVASSTLSNFLKANGVSITNQKFNIKNTKELAKIGRPSTLQLFCMNTKTVFDELKKKKKHSDVLFEKVMDIK